MIDINIKKELLGSYGKMDLEVNLQIKQGDFLAISGESGSGKTTLLRILAGLEEAQGKIEVNNKIWLDNKDLYQLDNADEFDQEPCQKIGSFIIIQPYVLLKLDK